MKQLDFPTSIIPTHHNHNHVNTHCQRKTGFYLLLNGNTEVAKEVDVAEEDAEEQNGSSKAADGSPMFLTVGSDLMTKKIINWKG